MRNGFVLLYFASLSFVWITWPYLTRYWWAEASGDNLPYLRIKINLPSLARNPRVLWCFLRVVGGGQSGKDDSHCMRGWCWC
ncbi:hypothetical protein QBC46DRAFT_370086 [Diplogelasinospora grovesii]|uniref:Uncharacterized protein n=1 Tax=Diplogelasinospora grovesii TaxID=303347 RepID=A0AAN6NH98_9PEZI|nr:hypothetical protein QBC46DRAFT_370086 [Diplogelasinospora grovesii]